MVEKYRTDIDADEGNFLIFDRTGYKLTIGIPGQTTREDRYDVWFNLPNGIPVTPGGIDTYPSRLSMVRIKATDKCLEVGSGLGEWIPHILSETDFDERPAVIEIADYQKIREMLKYAVGLRIDLQVTSRLESLVGRCDVYLDSEKVNLINQSLVDAIQDNSELVGRFDMIVDVMGAGFYRNMSSYGIDVTEIEKRLLASGGVLISQDPNKTFRNIEVK